MNLDIDVFFIMFVFRFYTIVKLGVLNNLECYTKIHTHTHRSK